MSDVLCALQSIWQAELNVRQAENAVLDTAQARLELQALTARLADQQQQLGATRRKQELQGCLHMVAIAMTEQTLSGNSTCITGQLADLIAQHRHMY